MTPVCSAYDRPRENQIGLAARPVANVALDTERAITEGGEPVSATGSNERANAMSAVSQFPFPALLPGLAALVLCWPEAAGAQSAADIAAASQTGGVLDATIDRFRAGLYGVGDRLGKIARDALLTLFVVDLVLRGGRAMFSDDSLPELAKGIGFQLGFLSCIWSFTLIVPEVVGFLADQALEIASIAGAEKAEAGGMVTDGLKRAVGWLGEIRPLSPGTWFYIFAAGISVIVLAIAVAMLVVTYAELYLSGMAGMLVLMFAGLTETRNKALDYINTLVAKAFKLMGIMIIVAATGEMTTALAAGSGTGLANAMGMVMLQLISAVLILTLPGTLETLVGARFAAGAAEKIGAAAGGVAKLAAAAGLGAAAGAVTGAASGTVSGVKAGAGAGNVAKAAGRCAATGARDKGIDLARATRNREVLSGIGKKVADRLGYQGAHRGAGGGDET